MLVQVTPLLWHFTVTWGLGFFAVAIGPLAVAVYFWPITKGYYDVARGWFGRAS